MVICNECRVYLEMNHAQELHYGRAGGSRHGPYKVYLCDRHRKPYNFTIRLRNGKMKYFMDNVEVIESGEQLRSICEIWPELVF